MDYIKALGFTTIWITPVVENTSGYDYHGYHASDMSKVDPRYLSEDVDFQKVIDEAHKRDMKICLDVVFNHTGNFGEANLMPMFTKEGDLSSINCLKMHPDSPLPDNYFSLNGGQQYDARIAAMKNTRNDGSDPDYIYHHYGNFSWESFGEQVAQIAGDCVDLNTENPVVAEYIVKSYGEFIKMGVDAFRIDTMKHISRLTLNNYIFPALYEYANKCGNTNFYMFGEVCTRVREVWNRNIPALSAPFYTWKEEKEYPWGDTETNLASIEKAYNDNNEVSNERTSTNAKLNGRTYHTPDYSASNGVGVIDFPMHWNFQYARDAFNLAKSTDQYYNDATYNVTYVDSHDYGPDGISTVRYNMGTQAWAENMSLMF
jgi:glycosidase